MCPTSLIIHELLLELFYFNMSLNDVTTLIVGPGDAWLWCPNIFSQQVRNYSFWQRYFVIDKNLCQSGNILFWGYPLPTINVECSKFLGYLKMWVFSFFLKKQVSFSRAWALEISRGRLARQAPAFGFARHRRCPLSDAPGIADARLGNVPNLINYSWVVIGIILF